jgi:hypothetical protein
MEAKAEAKFSENVELRKDSRAGNPASDKSPATMRRLSRRATPKAFVGGTQCEMTKSLATDLLGRGAQRSIRKNLIVMA